MTSKEGLYAIRSICGSLDLAAASIHRGLSKVAGLRDSVDGPLLSRPVYSQSAR